MQRSSLSKIQTRTYVSHNNVELGAVKCYRGAYLEFQIFLRCSKLPYKYNLQKEKLVNKSVKDLSLGNFHLGIRRKL